MELIQWLYVVAIVSILVGAIAFFIFIRGVKRDVEDALKEATTEEQVIIRNKLVKAMFPPRFNR